MVGLGNCSGCDAGEALDIFVEFETSVEAPFEGRQIAVGVLGIERAAGAGDRALDVSETGVDPFEERVCRPAATGHQCDVAHARFSEPKKALEPVANGPAASFDVGCCILPDRRLRERFEPPQLRVDGLAVTRCDGDHERGLIGGPSPCFTGLFTTEIGIINLHVAGEFVDRIALAHDLHQLLFDEPGGVPLDAELTRQFKACDVVLGARYEMHGEEPLGERRR